MYAGVPTTAPSCVRLESRSDSPRQAEVDQPGTAEVVDQDVGRLDVPVQDPLAVGVVDGVGQVAEDPGGGRRVEAMMVAIPVQRPPADEMEGHPAAAVVEARVVDGHDVGMVQPRRGPGLAEEALHHALARIGLLEHLEGHVPVEPGVVGQVDVPEAPVSQPLAELKSTERAQRTPAPGLRPVGNRSRIGPAWLPPSAWQPG